MDIARRRACAGEAPGNLSLRGPWVSCIIFQEEERCRVWRFLWFSGHEDARAKGTPRDPSLIRLPPFPTPSVYSFFPVVGNEDICFRVRSDGKLSPRIAAKNTVEYLVHVPPALSLALFYFLPPFSSPPVHVNVPFSLFISCRA